MALYGYKERHKVKRILLVLLVIFACASVAYAFGHANADFTPAVEYSMPANDHEIDLTGQDSLTFGWRHVPIPSGNREAYRFELFEETGGNSSRIFNKELPPDVYSIDIPASMFKDGRDYTWSVMQRDERTFNWSRNGNRWRFTVVKK